MNMKLSCQLTSTISPIGGSVVLHESSAFTFNCIQATITSMGLLIGKKADTLEKYLKKKVMFDNEATV
jgi:hypothetical protein